MRIPEQIATNTQQLLHFAETPREETITVTLNAIQISKVVRLLTKKLNVSWIGYVAIIMSAQHDEGENGIKDFILQFMDCNMLMQVQIIKDIFEQHTVYMAMNPVTTVDVHDNTPNE